MRISSEIFPFASHEVYGYNIDYANDLLKQIGQFAKLNKIRITMHPAQFNVLSSPNEKVIQSTFRDLIHHCDILDKMGLDQNSVMIVHGGGVYNDKQLSLQRFEQNFLRLPLNVQKRLVIENCEMSYSIDDLLPISQKLLIPIVIDSHHDDLKPSEHPVSYYFDKVFEVWKIRNIKPKIHVSNSQPHTTKNDSLTIKRKHSDYIYFFHEDLYKIKIPIDVMLECKMKEDAILKLRNQ